MSNRTIIEHEGTRYCVVDVCRAFGENVYRVLNIPANSEREIRVCNDGSEARGHEASAEFAVVRLHEQKKRQAFEKWATDYGVDPAAYPPHAVLCK